jgi:hypothetical protein
MNKSGNTGENQGFIREAMRAGYFIVRCASLQSKLCVSGRLENTTRSDSMRGDIQGILRGKMFCCGCPAAAR